MYLCLVYYYTIYNFDSKAINCYLKNILNPNEHPYYELLTNENYIYRNDSVQETYNGNVSCIEDRSCYDEGKRVGETLCYFYKIKQKILCFLCVVFTTAV